MEHKAQFSCFKSITYDRKMHVRLLINQETMMRFSLFSTALLFGTANVAFAQTPSSAPADLSAASPASEAPMTGNESTGTAAETAAPATPSADEVTVEARNAAIAAFTQAQQAEAAGQSAQVIAALDPHLTTLRQIGSTSADAADTAFIAAALTAYGNAKAQGGDLPGATPFLAEAAPLWKKAHEASPADPAIRVSYATTLVNLGNLSLAGNDKVAAEPYFEQVVAVAEPAYASNPADAANANALLSALIGMNNVTQDPAWFAKVKTVAQAMNSAGTLSAANRPAVAPLLASG